VTDPAALGSDHGVPDMDALEGTGGPHDRPRRARTHARRAGRPAPPRPGGPILGSRPPPLRGCPLQSDNLPADLAARVFPRNETDRLLELGGEAGGPLKDGRLWLWGAVARNALRQDAFTGHAESLRTTTFSGKGRLRLGTGALFPAAAAQRQVGRGPRPHDQRGPGGALEGSPVPTTLLGLEDTRTWGRLSLVSRLA